MNLDFNGTRFRVVCDEPDTAAHLREVMDGHLVTARCEAGFVIRAPRDRSNLFVLLDRTGNFLARTADRESCVAALLRHLTAFAHLSTNAVRFRGRALVGPGPRVVFAGWPLFADGPVVERRLERAGHQIVDRLVVDVDHDGCLDMAPVPSHWSHDHVILGHADAPQATLKIARVLVPQLSSVVPTTASVVAYLAGSALEGQERTKVLDVAESLTTAEITPVRFGDRMATYRALDR